VPTHRQHRPRGARNVAFAVLGVAAGTMLALGQGDTPEYPPLDLKADSHVTEEGFGRDYLDWIAFRAGIGDLDATYGKRLEEARFALRQHLAYLDAQSFLSATAGAYRGYLKDLDSVQDRLERWRALGKGDSDPDYAEAVAGFIRKTVYDDGKGISPEVLETNYFAQRMWADDRIPAAEKARDRNGILECYNHYVATASKVPPGKTYDPFRIDVLRKAVASGRQVFVLNGDKADRGFAQSVNPDDARGFVRLCASLRELSPADPDGELKAAAAIGKWGAGDVRGAYAEALPVVELRRSDGAFAVFCARLASAGGHADHAVKWLGQALRGDPRDFPSAALVRENPDFAAARGSHADALGTLASRLEVLENLGSVAAHARLLEEAPPSLEACRELHGCVAGLESPVLQSHLLAATILGLRWHGKEGSVGELEANFEALRPPGSLRARLGADALMDSCARCNGSGIDLALNLRCARCGGGGQCVFEYCRKGIRFSPFDRGFGGRPPVRRKCGDCQGSGVCRYCKGRGKATCPACDGGARAFSKARIEGQIRTVAAETVALAEREREAFLANLRRLPVP